MDESILVELIECLAKIFSPSSSNQDRQQLQKKVDEISNSSNGILFAAKLAHAGHGFSDQLRHFGCSMLCNSVKFQWSDLSCDQQLFLKSTALDLLRNGTKDLLEEQSFIKEKVISLMVELVKRTWPLQWLDLDTTLIQIYSQDITRKELVMLVYRSLAEDLFLYQDLVAESRKTELVTALTSVMVSADVLSNLYSKTVLQKDVNSGKTDFVLLLNIIRSFPQNVGWIMRWVENAKEWISVFRNSLESHHSKLVSEKLLIAFLSAVLPLLDWIQHHCLISSNLLLFLIECLGNEFTLSIKLASVECLIVLFSRNFSPTGGSVREELFWEPLLHKGKIHSIYNLYSNIYKVADYSALRAAQHSIELDDDHYKLLKRFTQMVCSLTCYQIAFKRNTKTPPNFSLHLEFLGNLMDHPSTFISTLCFAEIVGILKHEYLSTTAEVSQFFPNLINLCLSKASKLSSEVSHAITIAYDEQDFDLAREVKFHQAQLKQRCVDTVKMVSQVKPYDSFSWISSLIMSENFLNSSKSTTNRMEAYSYFLEVIVQSQPENDDTKTLVRSLIEYLFRMNLENHYQIMCKISMVKDIALLAYFDPQLILSAIHHLFGFVVYQLENIGDTNGISVRRKASGALIKLAGELADPLRFVFQDIIATVSQIMASANISASERTLLYEFLLTLLFNSSNSEGLQLFDHIMSPILVTDLGRSMELLTSTEIFINSSGIIYLEKNSKALLELNSSEPIPQINLTELQAFENSRKLLKSTLITICVCLRRFNDRKNKDNIQNNIWTKHIANTLHLCLSGIRHCHSLSNPSIQNQISCLKKVTSLGFDEKMIILGISLKKNEKFVNYFESEIHKMSVWYSGLREASYRCLSQLLQLLGDDFYVYPDIGRELNQSLFCEARTLPNATWRTLVNLVFKPIILSCPSTHYDQVLEFLVPPLLQFLPEKLDQEWSSIICKSDEFDNEENIESIPEEVVSEKLLRDLTRAYSDLLFGCLRQDMKKGTMDQFPNFLNPSLAEYILSGTRCQPFFNTILRLLEYKDIHACNKALTIMIGLTPILIQNHNYHEVLGKHVLMKALEVLHDGYKKENHNDAINLFSEIYYNLASKSPFPNEILLSIPGMTPQKLSTFDNQMSQSTPKTRQLLTKSLFEPIIGLEVSKLFQKSGSFILTVGERELLSKPASDSQRGNILENCDSVNLDSLYDG